MRAGVDRYLEASGGTIGGELAAGLGWGYHQVWHVRRELALADPDRQRGTAMRPDAVTADRLRGEVARRAAPTRAWGATVRDAGELLDMEVGTAETLIRQCTWIPRTRRTAGACAGSRVSASRHTSGAPARCREPDPSDDGSVAEDLLTFTDARQLVAYICAGDTVSEMSTSAETFRDLVRTLRALEPEAMGAALEAPPALLLPLRRPFPEPLSSPDICDDTLLASPIPGARSRS